jgi:hypothetical protein
MPIPGKNADYPIDPEMQQRKEGNIGGLLQRGMPYSTARYRYRSFLAADKGYSLSSVIHRHEISPD